MMGPSDLCTMLEKPEWMCKASENGKKRKGTLKYFSEFHLLVSKVHSASNKLLRGLELSL